MKSLQKKNNLNKDKLFFSKGHSKERVEEKIHTHVNDVKQVGK